MRTNRSLVIATFPGKSALASVIDDVPCLCRDQLCQGRSSRSVADMQRRHSI